METEMSVARTIREGRLGKHSLHLDEKDGKYFGLLDSKKITEGDDPDKVWMKLHDEAGKSNPRYFGYADARNRFLKLFPDGFHSSSYAERERTYKLAAKAKLDETAPLEKALTGTGFGEAILSVYRATNLLSPFEKTRLQGVLRGPNADSVIQAAAAFAKDGDEHSLGRLDSVLKPHDAVAIWTVATYLPFLWRPDKHMFLKPEVTRDYAERVGHPFALIYEARLNYGVYASLLDLAERTSRELADLEPRDRIDIQSFIWVVEKDLDEDAAG